MKPHHLTQAMPGKKWLVLALSSTLACASAPVFAQASSPSAVATTAPAAAATDWRELQAYSLGVQAFHYLYPWAYMPGARWTRTENADRQANRFAHIRHLETAAKTSGGAPNNDTLYSRAWLYVKDEPVIISVPAIRDRYYTLELVDWMGDNFDYIGTRATGREAGDYAVVPVGWKGRLPKGVKALQPVSTPWAIVMGRTFIKDESELATVQALQDQYRITPLSQWGKANAAAAAPTAPAIWKPLEPKSEPLAVWKNINRSLAEVPPDPRDADLLASFRSLGIGPGLDIEAQAEPIKRGLARAAVDGQTIVAQAIASGYLQNKVNGWNYPPKTIGRPSQTRNWLFRAMQALGGWVANDPEEAIYLNVGQDADGQALNGANRYEIRFKPGGLPQVKAFWSITMYNPQFNLVANEINRYALGDRSGLRPDADGGLTLYVQKDRPEPDKVSNWLPAPEGRFLMFLRAYLPGDDLLQQSWQPPSIQKLK